MRSGSRLAMVHIGDSRAYVLRGDTLTQVTTDHSFVQYLVDTGQITPEEAEHHPNRNVVLKILGDAQADVAPDETIREAVVGDRWMLCPTACRASSPRDDRPGHGRLHDPGECAEELIRLALLGGGPDNIAVRGSGDIVPAGTFRPLPADRGCRTPGPQRQVARGRRSSRKVLLPWASSAWHPQRRTGRRPCRISSPARGGLRSSRSDVLVVAASWMSWK